jgi:hypothetical protein
MRSSAAGCPTTRNGSTWYLRSRGHATSCASWSGVRGSSFHGRRQPRTLPLRRGKPRADVVGFLASHHRHRHSAAAPEPPYLTTRPGNEVMGTYMTSCCCLSGTPRSESEMLPGTGGQQRQDHSDWCSNTLISDWYSCRPKPHKVRNLPSGWWPDRSMLLYRRDWRVCSHPSPHFRAERVGQQKNRAKLRDFLKRIGADLSGFALRRTSRNGCLRPTIGESPRRQHDSRGERCYRTKPSASRECTAS